MDEDRLDDERFTKDDKSTNESQESNERDSNERDSNEVKMKIEKEITDPTEKLIQELNDKIVQQKEELDTAEDRLKRVVADFENHKKREGKERERLYSSVMGDVIIKMLPAIDDLEKAAVAESGDKQYQEGVKLVLQRFKDILKANNVTEIPAVGKEFDPQLHEAVSMCEDSKLGPNMIKEEYRKGYMIGDRVLRHSMVTVTK